MRSLKNSAKGVKEWCKSWKVLETVSNHLNSSKTGWILLQVLIETAKSIGSVVQRSLQGTAYETFQKQSFVYLTQFISGSENFQADKIF